MWEKTQTWFSSLTSLVVSDSSHAFNFGRYSIQPLARIADRLRFALLNVACSGLFTLSQSWALPISNCWSHICFAVSHTVAAIIFPAIDFAVCHHVSLNFGLGFEVWRDFGILSMLSRGFGSGSGKVFDLGKYCWRDWKWFWIKPHFGIDSGILLKDEGSLI